MASRTGLEEANTARGKPRLTSEQVRHGLATEGAFLTYGLGVPLLKMLDVTAALARVPVTTEGGT